MNDRDKFPQLGNYQSVWGNDMEANIRLGNFFSSLTEGKECVGSWRTLYQ